MGHSSILKTNLDSEVEEFRIYYFTKQAIRQHLIKKKKSPRKESAERFAFERRSNEASVVSH